ncbi:MAG: hypothetical protein KGJ00_13740 [Bradyrhizobium sp.]|nr:hypothetical protein [Bradyrhizobium sp.]
MYGSRTAQAGMLIATLAFPAHSTLAAVSPFTAMAGTWTGGGVLQSSDGTQERLRCRADYDPAGRAELHLNLRCASASYNFDLTSDVQDRNGRITGSWTEASRNASGTISGRAAGGRIEALAQGENFSAGLSLSTRGNQQFVSLRPRGTNITDVSLQLNRQ